MAQDRGQNVRVWQKSVVGHLGPEFPRVGPQDSRGLNHTRLFAHVPDNFRKPVACGD